MKNNLLQLAFGLVVLVLGGGLEEFLPKVLGVGFPVLLTATQFWALRAKSSLQAVLFALLAGAFEDALSSLPPMTSVSFFPMSALFVRQVGFPRAVTALTYSAYQLWLLIWTSVPGGEIFNRLLLSVPVGMLTAWAVGAALTWIRTEGAIDEQG